MKIEIVKEWIAQLRSGNFNQCRYRQRNADGEYCAIGILVYKTRGYSAIDTYVPMSLIGIVVHMNDLEHKSFNEIADYIEEYFNLIPKVKIKKELPVVEVKELIEA